MFYAVVNAHKTTEIDCEPHKLGKLAGPTIDVLLEKVNMLCYAFATKGELAGYSLSIDLSEK